MNVSDSTVLFVLPWSLKLLGGVNQVVINLAQEAQRAGRFKPLVLVTDWNAPTPVWGEVQGIRTLHWRVLSWRPQLALKQKLQFHLWEPLFRRQFLRFCREHGVRAINVHYPNETAFALERLVRHTRIPLFLSFHGTDVTRLQSLPTPEKTAWNALLQRVRRVMVCSRELGQRLQHAVGDGIDYLVIYNGVGDLAPTGQPANPVPQSGRVILNIGKYETQKGQDVLVRAFAELSADYPDLLLVFVGATASALESLKALCQTLGIDGRVLFVQDVNFADIPPYYQRAEVFCLPSRKEGFPLVLLEAARFNVPLVATRVGGIPELINSGENGLLVAPDNPAELATALRFYLEHPATANEMAARLFNKVEDGFTWKKAYEAYEHWYGG